MIKKVSQTAFLTIALVFITLVIASSEAIAKDASVKIDTRTSERINLVVGKSAVVESAFAVKRVSLAAPQLAEALVLSPRQIYLTGKAPGITNLTLWEGDTVVAAYDVEVSPDILRLKETLHDVLPMETNIKVSALHDTITLSGPVSSAANLSQAMAIAAPYGKVTNLLEVGGIQQVMLEVRISEMQKSLLRRLGINFSYLSADGRHLGLSLLNGLTHLPPAPGWPANPLVVSDHVNAIYQWTQNGGTWTSFVDALKEQGLLSILAEPTLIAQSGQTASFNAGGELPIPEASGLGTVSIKYKKFGVGLNFTPTVLSDSKISMVVQPRVSDIDFSNAIMMNGFVIPAFTERDVATTVELGDGQSFAIAGLLNENVTETVSKFPVLGDIPILGALFRSSQFKKNETELVVIVTPHLVKPLDMAKQTLPTDKYSDPGDFKFYLMGVLSASVSNDEKQKQQPVALKREGFDGQVGHLVP